MLPLTGWHHEDYTIVTMSKEITNEELARLIAEGFAGTATKEDMAVARQDVAVLKQDVAVLKRDMVEVKGGLSAVEAKLDRVLYKELDRHEHWIRQLAEKVGLELSR